MSKQDKFALKPIQWVAYNSETGEHISKPFSSFEDAEAIAKDWNHDGAPNLFRVRDYAAPASGSVGLGFRMAKQRLKSN